MNAKWIAITTLLACAACPAAPRSPMRAAPQLGLAKPRGPVLTERVITSDAVAPRGAIVVGERVAWIDEDTHVRVAPLVGGGSTTVATLDYLSLLIAYKGDVLAIGPGLWRVPLDGGAPVQLVEQIDAQAAALVGDTLVLAMNGAITKVQLTGGEASEPVELVPDGGEIAGVAVHDGFVYWADNGVKPLPRNVRTVCVTTATDKNGKIVSRSGPCEDNPRDGAIWRVALAGGTPQLIAGSQFGPVGVGVRGEHVYWSSDDGEALMRAPSAGGKPEVVLRGRGAELALDEAGAVVLTDSGLLVEEVVAGKAPRVRSAFVPPEASLALTPDEIITTRMDEHQIVAVPRGESRLTVIAAPRGTMDDLMLVGGRLVYTDTHRAVDRDDRVISIGLRGEAPRVLARARAGELRFGTDGEHAVFGDVDNGTIWVDGAPPIVVDVNPLGVAIEGDTVYYTDGSTILSVPRGGGPPTPLFAPEGMGWGTSGGPPEVQITVEDGVVHAASFPLPGLVRASATGSEVLLENIDRFAAIPGGGFVVYGQDLGLFTYPDKRTLLPNDAASVNAIAADATDAWVLVYGNEGVGELRRIPLDGGAAETVLEGLGFGQLVVTEGAIFIRSGEHDVLLRLTR